MSLLELREAEETIDRLRAEVERLTAVCAQVHRYACAVCGRIADDYEDGRRHAENCPQSPRVAEIARLRGEVERLKSENLTIPSEHSFAERAKMMAEIARLRGILSTALVPCPECGGTGEARGGVGRYAWVGPCPGCHKLSEDGRSYLRAENPGWVPWREP